MDHYEVDVFKAESIDRVLKDLNEMKIPCVIKIYDRVLQLDTKEEMRVFIYGCEIGNYVALDKKEGKTK